MSDPLQMLRDDGLRARPVQNQPRSDSDGSAGATFETVFDRKDRGSAGLDPRPDDHESTRLKDTEHHQSATEGQDPFDSAATPDAVGWSALTAPLQPSETSLAALVAGDPGMLAAPPETELSDANGQDLGPVGTAVSKDGATSAVQVSAARLASSLILGGGHPDNQQFPDQGKKAAPGVSDSSTDTALAVGILDAETVANETLGAAGFGQSSPSSSRRAARKTEGTANSGGVKTDPPNASQADSQPPASAQGNSTASQSATLPDNKGIALAKRDVRHANPELLQTDGSVQDGGVQNEFRLVPEVRSQTESVRAGDQPFGPRQTARAVAAQIVASVQTNPKGQVEIALRPEELGHIRLVLHAQDGRMSVILHADRPETADLMRRHFDILQNEFKDLGYKSLRLEFGQNGRGNQQARDQLSGLLAQQSQPKALGQDHNLNETDTREQGRSQMVTLAGLDLRL